MSVSSITDLAPALQQQLTRACALMEPGHGTVTEAVALELVRAWSLFWLRGALLTRDTLVSPAASVLAERPGLKIATAARLKSRAAQYADIAFDRRADIGVGEALAVAARKAGASLACACRLRALAGGADDEQVRPGRLPAVLTGAAREPPFPRRQRHPLSGRCRSARGAA